MGTRAEGSGPVGTSGVRTQGRSRVSRDDDDRGPQRGGPDYQKKEGAFPSCKDR